MIFTLSGIASGLRVVVDISLYCSHTSSIFTSLVFKGAFQRIIGKYISQKVHDIYDYIAAVCPVQRGGFFIIEKSVNAIPYCILCSILPKRSKYVGLLSNTHGAPLVSLLFTRTLTMYLVNVGSVFGILINGSTGVCSSVVLKSSRCASMSSLTPSRYAVILS